MDQRWRSLPVLFLRVTRHPPAVTRPDARALCRDQTSGFSFHVGSAKFRCFSTDHRSVRKCEARASRVKGRRMYAVDPEDAAPRPPPPHAPYTRHIGATEHTYHIHGAVTKRCDS